MVYEITITFTVHNLKGDTEAHDFGTSLAEHVADTFNDDESISSLVHIQAKRKRRR